MTVFELLLAPIDCWNSGLFSFPQEFILFSFTCGSNGYIQKNLYWQEINSGPNSIKTDDQDNSGIDRSQSPEEAESV